MNRAEAQGQVVADYGMAFNAEKRYWHRDSGMPFGVGLDAKIENAMKLEVRPNKEGLLTIECLELENWSDGDKLVRYLKRNLAARVKDKVAGPDSRRWFLSVGGKKVSVDQWDLGFLSVSALSKRDETIIPDIAEHLRQISTEALN